ncbi:DUF4143 domain-containing protein [Nesterenkonia muleiensis]|uniref:DUF4143 domain-containing protein n=1 Tax=Nesterenkonia muleiensis TaxID=2282648 RepID=UPI000E753F33
MYIERSLQHRIVESMGAMPVVVLHGARSVGKTSLIQRLKEQGVLAAAVSLADTDVLHLARQDVLGWLRALPQPFAVDEAQLLPELPLALKNYLDETGDGVQALLTGSAQIGRSGLGGSDPLAGRTMTFTLPPLTEAELLSSNPKGWSVVDQMFRSQPRLGHRAEEAFWWHDAVLYGGLPRTRTMKLSRALLRDQLAAAMDAILTDHVLPDERFDVGNARRVLDYVLRHPAGELKVQVIGREVGLDPRTVDRYLDVLERRFLITELQNLRPPAKKTPRTTAKAYPGDIAFSARAHNVSDVGQQPDRVRGGLFEAFVAQQLTSHCMWAETRSTLWHWRQVKSGRAIEVDLVLEDTGGNLLGIEVKSGSSVRADAAKGLRALRDQYGDRVVGGYVITSNAQTMPMGNGWWAIPADALRDHTAWQ